MREKGSIKYQYMDMELEFDSEDLIGNPWEREHVKAQIHNLRINNIYKEWFEGNMPFPNAKWLELSYIN